MKHLELKNKNCIFKDTFYGHSIDIPKPPITTIYIGGNPGIEVGVDKKFNWFQKKMIKWCFGFDIKENRND